MQVKDREKKEMCKKSIPRLGMVGARDTKSKNNSIINNIQYTSSLGGINTFQK